MRRIGEWGKVARGARRASGILLALSSAALAQSVAPPTTEQASPTEFPGVVQGGVVAASPPTACRPWSTQRNFAFVATEGSYNGFGLGARAGSLRVGVDASFAFLPVFATYSPDPETFPDFKLLASFQTNAAIYVGLYRPGPRTDLGIALGYKYNSLLRHGASVAFYLQQELGAHFTLQGFVGPNIFPEAEDRIREKTGWVAGSVSSGLAWHQAGLSVSLAYFP
ncbi:MAG TPA: hypothetical protein VK540_32735 [Polyangiaceae bacterium]|nr:hypothetical protein [Polyangiaceae bacterium]